MEFEFRKRIEVDFESGTLFVLKNDEGKKAESVGRS
jgi:hypothetical protein